VVSCGQCLRFNHYHVTINVMATVVFFAIHSQPRSSCCVSKRSSPEYLESARTRPVLESWPIFFRLPNFSLSSRFKVFRPFVSILSRFNMILPVEIEDLESAVRSCRSAHAVECNCKWCLTYVLYSITFCQRLIPM
jgi:hypothetical protein